MKAGPIPPVRRDWPALELDTLDMTLLWQYWLGAATPDEIATLEAWFQEKPGRRPWCEQLRRGLTTGEIGELSPDEVTRRTAAVVQAIGRQTATQSIPIARIASQKQAASLGRPVRRAMWSVAIGAIVGAVLLIVGWRSGIHRLSTTLSAHTSTYATANGERATITLPDGSTVMLNVASRLQVPADYAAGNRVVRLTGEALFTVAHQGGAAFTVLAGPSTTRVLGTSFVVRHYVTDTATIVAVRDGKVAVGGMARESAVVTEAEEIAVGPRDIGPVRPIESAVGSFAAGVLTLNGVPLPAAIPELDRWYDADIRLGDAQLSAKGVTSEFAAGSLADLTELLEGTFNVRVVRVGRVLTLYAR